ncbi:MAG: hypothetical protein AAB347_10055 [Bacteroidota bacterium]
MSDKFHDRYRISSARAQWWDYSNDAAYFITICTYNHECLFGEIYDCVMHLSEIGETVEHEWVRSLSIRPDMNLTLGAYTIMPNHFHGIIIIGKNRYNSKRDIPVYIDHEYDLQGCRDAMHCVSTESPINIVKIQSKNHFGPQYKNLSSIIRGFKSAVTTKVRWMHHEFEWQARFYDNIIRDEQSFNNISEYIHNNVAKWEMDKFFRKYPNKKG